MKKQVQIMIAGKTYRIVSELGEEYIQEIARYINTKVQKVQERAKLSSRLDAVVLASLDITDELLQARKAAKQERIKIGEEIDKMAEQLETVLENVSSPD